MITEKFIDKMNKTYLEANSFLWQVKNSVDIINILRKAKRKTKNKDRLLQLEDCILDEKNSIEAKLQQLEKEIEKFKNLFKNKKL